MERLQTLYGSVNVYINKMFLNEELQIHVSFVDNKNKLHVLLMQRSPAGWKIAEQASTQVGLWLSKSNSIALLKMQLLVTTTCQRLVRLNGCRSMLA